MQRFLIQATVAVLCCLPHWLVAQETNQQELESIRDELQDSYPDMYRLSKTVEKLGSNAAPILPELLERIQIELDKDLSRCGNFVEVLGLIGPKAKSATPLLLELLENADQNLRFEAARSLCRVGVEKESIMVKIMESIEQLDWGEVEIMIGHLVDCKLAGPTGTKLLSNDNVGLQKTALEILSEIETVPATANVPLRRILQNEQRDGRWRASVALGKIPSDQLSETEKKETVRALIEALKDKDKTVRHCSAEALGKTGQKTEDVVNALCHSLSEDDDSTVRYSAADALGMLSCLPERSVPALLKALSDDDFLVKSKAALSLEAFGKNAKSAIPIFVDMLENGGTLEQLSAIRFLMTFAKSNDNATEKEVAKALAALRKAAKSSNQTLRWLAESALSELDDR